MGLQQPRVMTGHSLLRTGARALPERPRRLLPPLFLAGVVALCTGLRRSGAARPPRCGRASHRRDAPSIRTRPPSAPAALGAEIGRAPGASVAAARAAQTHEAALTDVDAQLAGLDADERAKSAAWPATARTRRRC